MNINVHSSHKSSTTMTASFQLQPLPFGYPDWVVKLETERCPVTPDSDVELDKYTHSSHVQRIKQIFKDKKIYESSLKFYKDPKWRRHLEECIVAAGDTARDPGAFTRKNMQSVRAIVCEDVKYDVKCKPTTVRTAIVCIERNSKPTPVIADCSSVDAWLYLLAVTRQWFYSKRGSFLLWWDTHNLDHYTTKIDYAHHTFRKNSRELTILFLCTHDGLFAKRVQFQPYFILPQPQIACAFGVGQQSCECFNILSSQYTTHPDAVPMISDNRGIDDVLMCVTAYAPLYQVEDEINTIPMLEKQEKSTPTSVIPELKQKKQKRAKPRTH